ncbi:sigma-70 family RNA polymerase sigma factor [Rossellomorea vietnamensis]|uniref:Sigma-70 family RNA polymerase sigma factor n=1 Tax=Rossellomorea vietnamensis TaxID=218284 RepID=A0ACD4C634_9BACI|nr:sigma-70 family RNA polymerase sigma factor [Rossellomorea vietnamensis]UXH44091.1 sigma-70 family RNA polymerase sigma factor [Rossellomorea vietnamensis]WQI95462.1 sigma-70 family RNA polymerase sigma factor [Rossellomorea vietnamensis]
MRKVKNDDHSDSRDAWLERIMDEYGERLTKLAYNYVKDWGVAEDIVQDVFITCFRHYEKIDEIISFKAWIYRLVINRSKDVLKSSAFKRVVMNSSLYSIFTSKEPLPDMSLVKRSEEEILSKSVLDLPLKYREVIILYYYEECSIEDIKGLLGLNGNTIKTRLNRGRMKLKSSLERWEHDGR